MTEEERHAISEKAKSEATEAAWTKNSIANLEKDVAAIKDSVSLATKAIWAVALLLGKQLWDFIASGGAIK